MRTLSIVVLAVLGGCDVVGGGADSAGLTGTPPTADWQPDQGGWEEFSHPCVGNRTDAMWWDDRQTVWVGCGSTTDGTGLFQSDDGGTTWRVAATQLQDFRVSSIQRAADGALYVAGIDTESSDRVVRIVGQDIEVVWQAGSEVWNSFHVGTFLRNADGVSVAESLTGTGIVVSGGDGDAFVDGSGWAAGSSYQILDMDLHANGFYGVGSTIAEPPRVFLPGSISPFELEVVQLADWHGELWGIDVDAGGIVVGGIDQGPNEGRVFTSGADPSDRDSWNELNVSELTGVTTTWIRGVCRANDLIVAVGENPQTLRPIVVTSADDGASWQDWTGSLPGDPRALHKCTLWDDGTLAVTGQSGYLAVWNP